MLSIASYHLIEQPFRDKKQVQTQKLFLVSAVFFLIVVGASFYVYTAGGIMRDVAEFNSIKSESNIKGSNERDDMINYNEEIYKRDKPFSDSTKIKILIIGNSYARDFANILLESKYGNLIEISYTYDINTGKLMAERLHQADLILFSQMEKPQLSDFQKKFAIDTVKVWNVGVKNFGTSNGIFYNRKHDENYCVQRLQMNPEFIEIDQTLKKEWGSKYINLLGIMIDREQKVPVFTPDCKFISQDGTHLTKPGAIYFSQVVNLDQLFNRISKN